MATKPQVTLYVDIVSPFAYEAFHILQNEPIFKDVQKTYVPITLGGLMKTCGNMAPIYVKNKDKWIQVERVRWSKGFNVPMAESSPPNFPPRTLDLMRALCGLTDQALLAQVLAELWHEFWVNHVEIGNPEVYGKILEGVVGKETAEKLIAEATTETGKAALLKNTDSAFEDGAFGIPWFVATNTSGQKEGFWGVDHVGQVVQFLGLEKPEQGGWKAVL